MVTFPLFPQRPQLMPDEVHVVRFRLDTGTDISALRALLDRDECRRADRFVRDRDRRRFVVAHGVTRLALGGCLGRPPDSLRFTANCWGKPALDEPANGLQFNLAHAGEIGLLAVGLDRQLGVDIEQQRPLSALELSRRFFSPGEHGLLESLKPKEQLPAFFRCWTRKESFIKALGTGLSFPLSGFEVSLAEEDTQLLRACAAAPAEIDRWKMVSLPIDAGYSAALTAEGTNWRVLSFSTSAS